MSSCAGYDAEISSVDEIGAASISALHPDIIRTHILTRLDGPTLASAGSTSSQLHSLSREDSLWSNICLFTWPSITSPRVRQVISEFPGGHRSFFADSFSLPTTNSHHHLHHRDCIDLDHRSPELISAVDVHYRGKLILSKVVETETSSGWFRCSPFRVDLLHPKDVVPTPIPYNGDSSSSDDCHDTCRDLEEGLTLSWILIDPIRRRAMNLSSHRPVSVQRHWLSKEVHVRFAAVLAAGNGGLAQCGVVVTCGGSEGGESMHVREVCLVVEDLEGMQLKGKDSLVILQRAMDGKRGNTGRRETEGKKRYEEYLERKRERKERRTRTEGALDILSASLFGLSAVFSIFWVTMYR